MLETAEKAVKSVIGLGADYADARAEQTYSTSIRLANERFEHAAVITPTILVKNVTVSG